MSNETKIGLLAVIAISLLIWGYKYIKGKNILKTSTYLYIQYEDIDLLSTSTPVIIQGLQVGIVSDIYFKTNNTGKQMVEVVLDIEKGIAVPKNTIADIKATGFMGGKAVELVFDRPCTGADCAKSGDYIQGRLKGLMSSMVDPNDMNLYVDAVRENVGGIVDSVKQKITGGGDGSETMQSVDEIIANLNSITKNLDILMRKSSGKIDGLLANMESITSSISSSNAQIKSIIANSEKFSSKLSQMDMNATMTKANTALDGTSATMTKLQGTLSNADQAMKDLSNLLTKVGGSEGTLGKLINDPAIAKNLEETLIHVSALTQDIRLHPERYRRILSKKTPAYSKPDVDPALQN